MKKALALLAQPMSQIEFNVMRILRWNPFTLERTKGKSMPF